MSDLTLSDFESDSISGLRRPPIAFLGVMAALVAAAIVMFAFDYDHKIIYCLGAFTPTGHYQHDLEQIMQRYVGHFSPKNPHWLAEPLQKLVKKN